MMTTMIMAGVAATAKTAIAEGAGDSSSFLRTSATTATASQQEEQQLLQRRRQSVTRRLYGPENGEVRKHVRLLEEKPDRSQTGFLGDPNHKVPYEDHPYDLDNPNSVPNQRRRRLSLQQRQLEDAGGVDTSDNSNNNNNIDARDVYKPMRIQFETQALDSTRSEENAAKIDFIKTKVLPATADFWSQALSVVPVNGNLKVSAAELENREFCGDSEFTKVPAEHISTGLPDTDLILYVSGAPSSRFCRGTTLAVAVACNFDQFDRPTAGAINVCLDRIDLNTDGTASKAILDDNVDVLVHEVAHVLGHSSNSYRFFWNPETGEERTSRPFEQRTVTCVDNVDRTLILPDENTMKFFDSPNGQRYAAIVTERVQSQARNQFDCQTLEGAKLENQPTGSDSCTGDHWDEHDYYIEALSGVISPTTNVLSHLTLALFEDSGWYLANYTQGNMNPWGLGAGCEFVNEPCLTSDSTGLTTVPTYGEGYFCTDSSARGCSPALTHKMACSVLDYFYIQPQTLPESRFQYFSNEPTFGGPRQADYCPLYGSTYGGLDAEQLACTDSGNSDSLNIYSEVYGSDSKCIPTDSGDGRCYRTACVKDEMALRINVRGEWLTCEFDFQTLDVRVGAGALPQTLVCPRLSQACPDLFCPFNCAGRGVCDYTNMVNGTLNPVCRCFDESDSSPGCSDSLLPAGDFLDDATGLFDNLEEDFFDPMIAVFVDHPDKWTTSSWAWAAGLFTVFLIMLLCVCSAFWPERKDKLQKDHRGDKASSPRKSSRSSDNNRGERKKKLSRKNSNQTSRPSASSSSSSRRGGSRRSPQNPSPDKRSLEQQYLEQQYRSSMSQSNAAGSNRQSSLSPRQQHGYYHRSPPQNSRSRPSSPQNIDTAADF